MTLALPHLAVCACCCSSKIMLQAAVLPWDIGKAMHLLSQVGLWLSKLGGDMVGIIYHPGWNKVKIAAKTWCRQVPTFT